MNGIAGYPPCARYPACPDHTGETTPVRPPAGGISSRVVTLTRSFAMLPAAA